MQKSEVTGNFCTIFIRWVTVFNHIDWATVRCSSIAGTNPNDSSRERGCESRERFAICRLDAKRAKQPLARERLRTTLRNVHVGWCVSRLENVARNSNLTWIFPTECWFCLGESFLDGQNRCCFVVYRCIFALYRRNGILFRDLHRIFESGLPFVSP